MKKIVTKISDRQKMSDIEGEKVDGDVWYKGGMKIKTKGSKKNKEKDSKKDRTRWSIISQDKPRQCNII